MGSFASFFCISVWTKSDTMFTVNCKGIIVTLFCFSVRSNYWLLRSQLSWGCKVQSMFACSHYHFLLTQTHPPTLSLCNLILIPRCVMTQNFPNRESWCHNSLCFVLCRHFFFRLDAWVFVNWPRLLRYRYRCCCCRRRRICFVSATLIYVFAEWNVSCCLVLVDYCTWTTPLRIE